MNAYLNSEESKTEIRYDDDLVHHSRSGQNIWDIRLRQEEIDFIDEAIDSVSSLRSYRHELYRNTRCQTNGVLNIEVLHV